MPGLVPRKSVKITDVARHCGVATSTVSRVLGGVTHGFSATPEVRKRILQAAAEMGYKPNAAVRSLRAKRTRLVAVVGVKPWSQSTPGVVEVALSGFAEALNERGYDVCTSFMGVGHSPYDLPNWRVDGALAVYVNSRAQIEYLEASGLPYVSIDGFYGPRGSAVMVDDHEGGRLAMQHLLDLGHRRIAYANITMTDTHPSVHQRHSAYRQAMLEAGLEPICDDLKLMATGCDRPSEAAKFVRRAALEQGATAILAYEHLLAVHLLQAMHAVNVSVPHQVSLCCFNDVFPCAELTPPLTAVSLPAKQLGETAAELLLRQMEAEGDGPPPARLTLPESLVVRASTGPVASKQSS